jgi:hypothetical protein
MNDHDPSSSDTAPRDAPGKYISIAGDTADLRQHRWKTTGVPDDVHKAVKIAMREGRHGSRANRYTCSHNHCPAWGVHWALIPPAALLLVGWLIFRVGRRFRSL